MSLEKQLEDLNVNLKALVAVLSVRGPAAPAAQAPTAAPAAAKAAEKAQEPAKNAALDYEKDVKPLALRVAKEKSRDKLVEILGEFKAESANKLKPEQWGEFIKKCNAALA